MKHICKSRQTQHGQAMIEFGIIFILLFVVFVGGAELAATALASNKVSEAAKAGVNEYGVTNQKRLSAQNSQKMYLPNLVGLGETSYTAPDSSSHLNFVAYLDTLDISDCLLLLNGLETDNPAWDVDANGEFTESEIKQAANSVDKFHALILIEQIKLSELPLDADSPLSESQLLLTDHDNAAIDRASCNVVGGTTDYIYGLPNRYVAEAEDKYPEYEVVAPAVPEIYLFHPLPIDLASCVGVDPDRGGRSRISILVSGYYNAGGDPALNVPGLPKLNQAMYSLYSKACLDENGSYMGCENTDPTQILLKAPGKLCLSTVLDEDLDSCTVDVANTDTAGFYYWNKNIDQVNAEAPEFSPTFQLGCSALAGDDLEAPIPVYDTECDGAPEKVRVHIRYRAIFESLLATGVQELDNAITPSFFYNPARVGTVGRINGFPGSEIGYIGKNGNPTLKKFKDLRGCYELDVRTNQVSACN